MFIGIRSKTFDILESSAFFVFNQDVSEEFLWTALRTTVDDVHATFSWDEYINIIK